MRTSFFVAMLIAGTAAHAAITGTLMTPEGVAISGARVSLLPRETFEARASRIVGGSPAPAALATVTSDARGRFAIDVPAAHALARLRIDAPGRAPHEMQAVRDQELGAIPLRQATPGRGCVTAAGKPVAGAMVYVIGNYGHATRTDANGRYEIPDSERAHIVVAHPEYPIVEAAAPQRATRSLDVTLGAGTPLRGRAVDEDGSPVANAEIFLDGWPLATSNADGSFFIVRAPRSWRVLVGRTDTLVGYRKFEGAGHQTLQLRRTATISGRVTDLVSGAAIAGAYVVAGSPVMNMAMPLTPVVLTDAKGRYTLRAPAGTQPIHLSHPLYVGDIATATAAAGDSATVDVDLRPLSVVAGTVVDERKDPVAAASIFIEDPNRSGSQPSGVPAHTAPDGSFVARFFTREANARVRAAVPGGRSATSAVFESPEGTVRRGIDIVIPDGIPISGRITDGEGKPLAGVTVVAIESDDQPARRAMHPFVDANEPGITSTVDGGFTIHLSEGVFDFSFALDGYAPKTLFAQKVARGSLAPLEITMERGLTISGRVMREGAGVEGVRVHAGRVSAATNAAGEFSLDGLGAGTYDVIISKSNEFIHDNRVVEAPADGIVFDVGAGSIVAGRVIDRKSKAAITTFTAGISRSVSTADGGAQGTTYTQPFETENGTFRFENVPAGAIEIVARAPGYVGGSIRATLDGKADLSDLLLELDRGISIRGRVTNEQGEPIDDVHVSAAPGQSVRGQGFRSAMTRPNGEYLLEGVDPDVDTVDFQRDGYVRTAKSIEVTGSDLRLDVQLSRGERITGSVVTRDGTPVEGALVNIFMNGPSESARTDSDGRFEIRGLPRGRYVVDVKRDGFPTKQLRDVDISSEKPLRITLGEGGTLTGRVTGLPSADLPFVTVAVTGGDSWTETAVDAGGSYRLEGAPAGRVSVSASLRKSAAQRFSETKVVDVTAGQTQSLDLEFREGFTIRGRVTRAGEALVGVNVTFSGDGGHLTTTTDAAGTYTLSGLIEGSYGVVVSTGPDQQFRAPYTVRRSATFDIDYPASSVRGRIVDASTGEPLANGRLTLRPNAPLSQELMRFGLSHATSDSTGAFAMEAVPPGSYVLIVSRDGFGNESVDVAVSGNGVDGLEVRLQPSDGVSLIILDGRSRQTLRGSVVVYDAGGRVIHQTSSGLSADAPMKLTLAPGSYVATVSAGGYAPRTITIASPSNQMVEITPGGTILVRSANREYRVLRLIDSNGNPYPNRDRDEVHALPHGGTARIRNVAPGTYRLEVLGPDRTAIDARQVTVQEGGVTVVEM